MDDPMSKHNENLEEYERMLNQAHALLARSYVKLGEMKERAKNEARSDETIQADAAEVAEALDYDKQQKTIYRIPPPPIWPC